MITIQDQIDLVDALEYALGITVYSWFLGKTEYDVGRMFDIDGHLLFRFTIRTIYDDACAWFFKGYE